MKRSSLGTFRMIPLILFLVPLHLAEARITTDPTNTEQVSTEWDGHIKVYTRALFPGSGTAWEGKDAYYDGFGELRLNNKTFMGESLYTEVHYELVTGAGDTRRRGRALGQQYPRLFPGDFFGPPNDDRRLFDLTHVLADQETYFSHHRLDRAMISLTRGWGEIRLGRQAVTWGHGFTFNPMDLFNPFAPTDLERAYKMGDDMALARFPITLMGRDADLELICVARRNPETGKTGTDENSFGGKLHFFLGEMEMDLMAARHYEDIVAGIGAVGYLGGAAWRWDLVATFLDDPSRGRNHYISAVANLDYSWTWLDKNVYGYVELYLNGLSDADYKDHFTDPAIFRRISRGDLFALGRYYASAHIHIEFHPLVHGYLTSILNLNDGSGGILPRLVYDICDNIRITLSGALYQGGHQTEYGGYEIPGTRFTQKPMESISAWMTWYF